MYINIIIATLCGLIIGIEREFHRKQDGIKINVLIAVGSCIFTMIGYIIAPNESRIVANIITGVGFMCAGVVIKDSTKIVGLTTSALVWISSAVGVMCGLGLFYDSIMISIGCSLFIGIYNIFTRHKNK
jgi:putative Mg2+ transporter-C (MgtC) family protein